MAKAKFVKTLSVQERLEAVWAARETQLPYHNVPPVPECRKLSVGDELVIGRLRNCIAERVSDDGRFVLVRYDHVENNYGNPIVTPDAFSARPWFDCIKKVDVKATAFARARPLTVHFSNSDVDSLLHIALGHGVVTVPDYQRDYVWTSEDKSALIESIFAGRTIGTFIFLEHPYEVHEGCLEVLDGKQRLEAVVGFYTSQFSHRGVYFHELSSVDKHRFLGVMVQYAKLQAKAYSRADILQIFLDTNVGGVPQTDAHLSKVRAMLAAEQENEAL